MKIALTIAIAIIVFLLYLQTQGRLFYFHNSTIVRSKRGQILSAPKFLWRVNHGFMARLVGMELDDDHIIPIYRPLFSVSYGQKMLIIEFGFDVLTTFVVILNGLPPYIHLVYDNDPDEMKTTEDQVSFRYRKGRK